MKEKEENRRRRRIAMKAMTKRSVSPYGVDVDDIVAKIASTSTATVTFNG